MSQQLALEIAAEIEHLSSLLERLDAFGEEHAWSAQALYHVRLVVEEMVVNVIDHGSMQGQQRPTVKVELLQTGTQLQIKVSDDGLAFDPLKQAAPDTESNLEDRPVGGLGVHFLRTLMDSVSYQRVEGWNRLRFAKQVC